MRLPRVLTSVTAALFAAAFAGPVMAAPTGGFIAVLDDDRNNGDSSNTVLYYDASDMSEPLFAIFAGWKQSNTQIVLGNPTTTGGSRSLSSLTVNPATGLTYVLEVDRDGPIGTVQTPGPNNDLFGVPGNTEGDYNILTFDFAAAYDHWVANYQGTNVNGSGTDYVTYISQGTLADPGAPAPAPGQHDLRVDNIQSYTAGPPNKNEVFFGGLVQKVGEVARPEFNDFTPNGFHSYIDTYLDFLDEDTLVLLDRPNAPLSNETQISAMTQADDSTVRILSRISTSPGAAPAYVPGSTEGGFNEGTTESWISTIIGQPLSDTTSPGEYVDVAFVNNKDGVTGLWIAENDQPAGTGDEISFFEITNLTGTSGNGLRQFNVGGGTTNFILDDNPVLDPLSNDGDVNGIHYNPLTGDIYIIESGNFDTPQDEPSVIIRRVDTYENGAGQINFGAWEYVQLDLTALPDDDTFQTEGRRTVYDHVENVMYFYDFDNSGAGGGGSFVFDWYALDLDTGTVTQAILDVDESTRGFGTEDRYEYFCLGDNCGAALLEGDLNGDGFVGIADLNIVLGLWNQNVTPGDLLQGDPSGDGFVGIADLNVVLGNWNAGTPPTGNAAIPEPASFALFTIAGLSALRRRR